MLDRDNPGKLIAARPGFLPGALPGRGGGNRNGAAHPELAPTGTTGLDALPMQAQLVNGLPFGGLATPPPPAVASTGTVAAGEAPLIEQPMPFAPAKPPMLHQMNIEPPARVGASEPPAAAPIAPPAIVGAPDVVAPKMTAPMTAPIQEAIPPGFVVAAPPAVVAAPAAVTPPAPVAPPGPVAAPAPVPPAVVGTGTAAVEPPIVAKEEPEAAPAKTDGSDSPWMHEPAPIALPSMGSSSSAEAKPAPAAAAPAKSGGGAAIWVVLGLVVLGGLGVGAYFLKSKLSGSPTPDDTEQPTTHTAAPKNTATAAPQPSAEPQVEQPSAAPSATVAAPPKPVLTPNPGTNPPPIPKPPQGAPTGFRPDTL